MHAEDLNLQNLSVKMFSQLRDQAPLELKEFYGKTLSFAESHHFVIDKFGRFPGNINFCRFIYLWLGVKPALSCK